MLVTMKNTMFKICCCAASQYHFHDSLHCSANIAINPNIDYIWYHLSYEGTLIMKLSKSVKPISYLKSHTAEALRNVSEGQQTMVITQHGEAKAVLQDIASYEQTQESLALLKMLAQSSKSIQQGRSKPLKKAFSDVRKHIKELAE